MGCPGKWLGLLSALCGPRAALLMSYFSHLPTSRAIIYIPAIQQGAREAGLRATQGWGLHTWGSCVSSLAGGSGSPPAGACQVEKLPVFSLGSHHQALCPEMYCRMQTLAWLMDGW